MVYDPAGADALRALPAGATLADTFTYTLGDGRGGTATATVTLTVTGVNDAPVAVADTAATTEDAAVAIAVLANDGDPDAGAAPTVSALPARSVLGAALTLAADGTVTYDPRAAAALQALGAGEALTDSFTYTVVDAGGLTATATASVTVAGRNDAPVAVADLASTDEDRTVVIAVLRNDRDADAADRPAVTAVQAVSDGGAAVVLLADGRVAYDPREAAALQALDPGQTYTDRFTYTVADGHGGTATATVTVLVTGREEPAVATDEDTRIVVAAPAGVTLVSVGRSERGVAATLENGAVAYDPRGVYALQALRAGESATDTVAFTGTTALGQTVRGRLTIVVTGVEDAPVAGAVRAATDADAAVTVDVAAAALDRDAGSVPTLAAVAATSARGAAVAVEDGRLRYDPTASASLAGLLVGEAAIDTVTYTLTDETGRTATGTLTVTVGGTRVETGLLTFAQAAGDEDTVSQFPLSGPWVLQGVGAATDRGATLSMAGGRLRYDPRRSLEAQALRSGETLTDTLTFTVVPSGGGAARTAQMTIVVSGRDDAPVAVADRPTVGNLAPATIDVLRNDRAADHDSVLTLAGLGTSAAGAALSVVDGKVVYDPSGVPAFAALAAGETRTDSFTYTLRSDSGGEATAPSR